jgi:hypothetical protein
MQTTNLTRSKTMKSEIIEVGKKLAKKNPNSKALKDAREWWEAGCFSKYSNQDCDILQAMVSELTCHWHRKLDDDEHDQSILDDCN